MLTIPLRGLTSTPPDGTAPDGDAAVSLGLLNSDGALRPCPAPKRIASYGGDHVIFIHHPSDGSEIRILASLAWTYGAKGGSLADSTPELPPAQEGVSAAVDVAAVGNTLCVATETGMFFWLWKNGTYVALGRRPEIPVIQFDLRSEAEIEAESDDYTYRCSPRFMSTFFSADLDDYDEDDKQIRDSDRTLAKAVSQDIHALLLSKASEKVTRLGLFWQPFFIRYAFRLFDGSHSWHSAPVLMLPTAQRPLARVAVREREYVTVGGNDNNYYKGTYRTQALIRPCSLRRRLARVSETLNDWGDIISGIDIFISAPIWTYRQSAEFGQSRPISDIMADGAFDGHRDGSDRFVSLSDLQKKGWSKCNEIEANDDIEDEIRSCSTFRLYESLEFADLVQGEFTQCAPKEKDLTSIDAREALSDEYLSHATLIPSVLYSYNSRLHAAGLRIGAPQPFPLSMSAPWSGTAFDSVSTRVRVWSRRGGEQSLAESSSSVALAFPLGQFPRFIYVPDPSAYQIEVSDKTYRKVRLQLTQHPTLNGSYWFGGLGKTGAKVFNTKTELYTQPYSESLPPYTYASNKVYVSEAGNPFVFPAASVVTVGQSSVTALASAVRPLSEGQFGDFPLYAFTDEGVWSLRVSETGSYSARQPVTRDVALSPRSVLQLDTSVVFASSRGLMRLSGSQSECLSEAAFGSASSSPMPPELPPEISAALSGGRNKPGWRPVWPDISFHEFLRETSMSYDYPGQRIILFSGKRDWGYVFSLKSGAWGMFRSRLTRSVPSYPEALAMDDDGFLVSLSSNEQSETSQVLLTRPLSLGDTETIKSIRSLTVRGAFSSGSVKLLLWGTRDLRTWHLIHSSADHRLRGFSGSGYRRFRLGVISCLSAGDSLESITIEARPRTSRLN